MHSAAARIVSAPELTRNGGIRQLAVTAQRTCVVSRGVRPGPGPGRAHARIAHVCDPGRPESVPVPRACVSPGGCHAAPGPEYPTGHLRRQCRARRPAPCIQSTALGVLRRVGRRRRRHQCGQPWWNESAAAGGGERTGSRERSGSRRRRWLGEPGMPGACCCGVRFRRGCGDDRSTSQHPTSLLAFLFDRS
jgi:hypothetical protein